MSGQGFDKEENSKRDLINLSNSKVYKFLYMNFCFDFHQFILFFIDILDFRVSNDVYRAISKQAHKTEIHFLEFSVTPPNITEILSCPRSLFRN